MEWLEKLEIKLSQLSTRLKLKLKLSLAIIALKRLDCKELDKQGLNLFAKEGIEENYIRENLISKN